jgi:hypothetical protein
MEEGAASEKPPSMDLSGSGKMVGGMMAARRMVKARAVVAKDDCVNGVGAFLSHYVNAEQADYLRRHFYRENTKYYTVLAEIFGKPEEIFHSTKKMPTAVQQGLIDSKIDYCLRVAQQNKLLGVYTYDRAGGSPGHIVGFINDPETNTLAFFDPQQQGRFSDCTTFYVRHLDIFRWKAENGHRVFGFRDLMNLVGKEDDTFLHVIAVYDVHPFERGGPEGKADGDDAGRFESFVDAPNPGGYPKEQWAANNKIAQNKKPYSIMHWNNLSDKTKEQLVFNVYEEQDIARYREDERAAAAAAAAARAAAAAQAAPAPEQPPSMELSGSGKMYGGATPAERGLAATIREMHPVDRNIPNVKKNAVGNFTLLLNQIVHSKNEDPAPPEYMKLIKFVDANNKFRNYGRVGAPSADSVADFNETDKRVRSSVPQLTLVANRKAPPKEAVPLAPKREVPVAAPLVDRPATPPPVDQKEPPTPKKRARSELDGDLEGEGIPQHMRRGEYFRNGMNR